MNDNIIPFKGAAAFLAALAAPAASPRRDIASRHGSLSPKAHRAFLSALATACQTDEESWVLPDVSAHLKRLHPAQAWTRAVNDP